MRDVLVIGAGPAGIAAAITAKQFGLDVLVVEKKSIDEEKICGDGLTEKSVTALSLLGITPDMLMLAGANEIHLSIHISAESRCILPHEASSCFTLQRKNLMKLLRSKAESLGVSILYNTLYKEEMIAGHIIDASGCQRKHPPIGSSFPVGISAIIRAETNLLVNSLYFVHHKAKDNGYCWAFPLSNNLWNIGIWQQKNIKCLKSSFDFFKRKYLDVYLKNIEYIRKPSGALLGTISGIPSIYSQAYICGDAAGFCDAMSGEGISNALVSGMSVINKLVF